MAKRKKDIIKRNYFILTTLSVISIFLLTLTFLTSSIPISFNNTEQFTEESKHTAFFSNIKDSVLKYSATYKILPSITMAQAALESGYGESELASKYYNLFGVKGNNQNGILLTTKEFTNNQWITIKDYFKVYTSWDSSIKDHNLLLANGTTWNKNQYQSVLVAKDYKEAAYSLVKSGYATDPNYAEKLITLIETYKLYQYDSK